MRIGIDATWARIVGSGTASYTRGLVRALVAHREHEFVLYFQSSDIDANPLYGLTEDNAERRVVDGWGQLGRTLAALTRACVRDDLDLFHSPGYFLPLWGGPKVVTFHDANMFLQWDKWWRTGAMASWLALCGQTVLSSRIARAVLTDSESAAREIGRVLRLSTDRLFPLYPGVDDAFFAPPNAQPANALREAHKLDEYLLFVSVLAPQKNLQGLLHAFALMDQPGLKLAVVGREYGTYLEQVIKPLIQVLDLGDQVKLLGVVKEDALPGLYASARAMVYPSFAEGFGLPPLEAMACSTPVVASNRPSLPEVLGNAAILVDPYDAGSMAAAIDSVLTQGSLRAELVRRGRERVNRFRWNMTAAKALEIYASVT